jgi:hypothetical protein
VIAVLQRTLSRLTEPDSRGPILDQGRYDRVTVWAFIWVLFAFKLGSVVVIAWAAGVSAEVGFLLSATTWPWLIIPAVAFSGPVLYRYRLRRVRARRQALQRSEWMID